MTDWEMTIGLEVHAQIKTKAKLFSPAPIDFGGEPNTQLALLDVAFPGMLPVINRECVDKAILAGLGFGATINLKSRFDRKNYFYPDLPQGYQISQYEYPIATGGQVEIDIVDDNQQISTRAIRLERIHIEQDAGKNIHEEGQGQGESKGQGASAIMSFVDLNRAGIGLMEIVSQPDMHQPEEAQHYVRKLRSILRYLDVCDGNMEEGSLRADVNISIAPKGLPKGAPLGTRCEIKNLNSIRAIGQAIEVEARHQIAVLEKGGKIEQETKTFDSQTMQTITMRSKEDAHDYRYFPDPDLPPLILTQSHVDKIAKTMPELPDDKKKRLKSQYQLNDYDISVLIAEKARADFFEECALALAEDKIDVKLAANWILGDLLSHLNKTETPIEHAPISAKSLARLIGLIDEGVISGKIAKSVFEMMIETKKAPETIIEEKNLRQITDHSEIEAICENLVKSNQDKVEQVKAKPKMLGWFVGEVMKETKGKANPQLVNEILRKQLKLQ